jgi:hypothetical protein
MKNLLNNNHSLTIHRFYVKKKFLFLFDSQIIKEIVRLHSLKPNFIDDSPVSVWFDKLEKWLQMVPVYYEDAALQERSVALYVFFVFLLFFFCLFVVFCLFVFF